MLGWLFCLVVHEIFTSDASVLTFVILKTGLIAAACGQLDSVLKEDRLSQKTGSRKGGMSNGTIMVKKHQNGSPSKPANGSFDDVYRSCNGVQV